MVFIFRAYFTLYNGLQFHPSHQNWFKWILFNGWVIFHCVYVPQLPYPFICWWASRLLSCWTVLILLMGVYVYVYIQSTLFILINFCLSIGLLQFCGVFSFFSLFSFFFRVVFSFLFFIILIFNTYFFLHLFLCLPFHCSFHLQLIFNVYKSSSSTST